MLCLSGFELYCRWVPLQSESYMINDLIKVSFVYLFFYNGTSSFRSALKARFRRRTFHQPNLIQIKAAPSYLVQQLN